MIVDAIWGLVFASTFGGIVYLRVLRDEINRLNEEAKEQLEHGVPKEWLVMLERSLDDYRDQRGTLWDPDITVFHLASDVNLIVKYLERQKSLPSKPA